MQHFGEKTVQTCIGITCDRCKTHYDEHDFLEIQEFMCFSQSCGYGSVFEDLNTRSIDLCQNCQKEVLGQWMQIVPYNVGSGEDPYEDLSDSQIAVLRDALSQDEATMGSVVSEFKW